MVTAGGFVVAGADPDPGGKVPGGGELGHVPAGLGDDDLSGCGADARDGVEVLHIRVPFQAGQQRGDPRIQLADRGGEVVERARGACMAKETSKSVGDVLEGQEAVAGEHRRT
ncbi:hypothetical protein OG302_42655 [Streptomyces sp. NBC_01283]|nr:hypothetical protein OG302_42655 [Streptomyces sp. NBC_01283]